MARPGLFIHRKLPRLARLAGVRLAEALGLLEFLWHAQYEACSEYIGDAIDVETLARWEGEAGLFTAAIVDAGFVDAIGDGTFVIHDFWDHAPDYVRKRAEREAARRARGVTLSEIRSASGRRGAAVANAGRPDTCKRPATDRPFAGQHTATVRQLARTPAPAPAPAPAPMGDTGAGSTPEPGAVDAKPKTPRKPAPHVAIFEEEARAAGLTPAVAGPDAIQLAEARKKFPDDDAFREGVRRYFGMKDRFLVENRWAGRFIGSRLQAILNPTEGATTPPQSRVLVGAHPPAKNGRPSPPCTFPPAPDGGGVWPSVLERLRETVDERDFDVWLRGSRQSGDTTDVLRVVVPSGRDFILAEYGPLLNDIVAEKGLAVPLELVEGI